MIRRSRAAGVVYFALDATRVTQFVKIGYTSGLVNRMQALKGMTGCGQTPIVLALEEGGHEREKQRHAEFAELRSHAEWFHYTGALKAAIAAMEHPFSYILDRPRVWKFCAGWGPLKPGAGTQFEYPPLDPDEELPPF